MKPKIIIGIGIVAVILIGVGTGVFFGKRGDNSNSNVPEAIRTATEVGVQDTKTFRDSAQGVIEAGGLSGDGTHKLVRDGGPTQTAYLLSSIVDLDEFVGKKVEVWGETIKGQKAGWLMDVGRVKLLE